MRCTTFNLIPLVGISLGFNIDASAIRAAEAAQLGEGAPHFGNITISGQMQQTSLIFPDGLHLLLHSPNAHNLSVEKMDQPSAPAGFVTPADSAAAPLGSGFWTAIYNYSWSIKFQEQNVDDVIATIEVPYDRDTLENLNVRYENTFLGRFDSTRGGWVVDTLRASVDSSQNKTRIIGSPNLDGEYMLLGRKSADSHGTFIQPGSSGESSDFRIEEPPANLREQNDPLRAPVQIGTWIDGFQLEVRSCKGMRVNMGFFNASEVKIQQGFKAISPYGYMLNSSEADTKVAVIARLPLRPSQTEVRPLESSRLRVAQFDPTSGEFRVAYYPASNTTSTLLRILPRAVEIETFSLDNKWLLIAAEPPLSSGSVTSNDSSTATAIATTASAGEDGHQALTTNTPSPSPPGFDNSIASPTALTSALPIATLSTEEGAEKVMKIEKPSRTPSRSRMRRIRYVKSEILL
ncbi:unnamed protein product [Rhizoctonia solani]|uniref:Uncharacterized protein n=1 Tax=Rhizoctonia solani TaxID=456999 RepID=A0A8H3B9A2_9AGAM|nr:unnamed protein product [Rhizoctonia solani]